MEIAPDPDEPSAGLVETYEPLAAPDPRPRTNTEVIASLDMPLDASTPSNRAILDLPLQSPDPDLERSRANELPRQSLVERARPTLATGPVTRSLVADLPLVEPSRPAEAEMPAHPLAPTAAAPRAASMNDRVQAALIDVGIWSAMTATAFYFASRIARTSIMGLGPAWKGLALFGVVLAAAYVLFFGGLSGATPGKIACGIHVRRFDGSPLGPLASLSRGALGVLGVMVFGLGVWPAFWDRDRRTLYDRATDSRVTIVV